MEELVAMCKREYPRLVGMLGLYCGEVDVAEDLAQEALIRLCRDWRKVSRMDAPERWLQRVAINLAHSHYRRRTIERRALRAVGARRSGSETPDVGIETLELLKKLPHRQKTALLLHYYLDLPVREVAEMMQVPEGTAKTLIHRGTHAFRTDATGGEAGSGI
ncbi:MAG: sigma-70 family RNA polymerase sigma factor [Actinomycetota bacterium]|nr:sigma-70 family RNA polymerase sigma factor [Actinomycetota bacterium]